MDVTGTKQEGREWQPERLRPQWGEGGRGSNEGLPVVQASTACRGGTLRQQGAGDTEPGCGHL